MYRILPSFYRLYRSVSNAITRRKRSKLFADKVGLRQERMKRIRKATCTVLVGLSDTQAVTSLALAIPTLTAVRCTISAYHYNLLCYLCVMASSSYCSTALVIHEIDESRRKFVPRFLLTVANLICTTVLIYKRFENKIFPNT